MDSGYNISDAYVERSLREQISHMAAQVASLQAENAALRELMNCYNLGGWTDSLALIKERDALQAENAALKAAPPAASEPVVKVSDVMMIQRLMYSGKLTPNTDAGWIAALEPFHINAVPQPTPALIEAAKIAVKAMEITGGFDEEIAALRRELEKL